MTTKLILLLCGVSLITAAAAQGNELSPLPRDLEIELALSAAPEHWQDGASAFVLSPSVGYELAKEGDNGFACLVGRTDWRRPGYSNDILIPICWDKPGVEAILPVRFEIEAMRARGVPKEDLTAAITTKYETAKYQAPAHAGYSPMLSPILVVYPGPDASEPAFLNYPHLMFYAPGLTMEDIGGRRFADPMYPWVLGEGDGPHNYIIQAMGKAESAMLNERYAGMLAKLCALNGKWCMQ